MRSLLSRFEPAPRRVLLLDATGVAVFERQGSELIRVVDFEPHADGYEAFRDFLSTLGSDPVYLLVDTVAEDFITDVIAHVGINDRQALLRRKLDQHFRGLEYRQVTVVGRETTG